MLPPSRVTLTQTWRSKVGSVSTHKLATETRMQQTEMTANTRAAVELVGSSHSNQTARCHAKRGTICAYTPSQTPPDTDPA